MRRRLALAIGVAAMLGWAGLAAAQETPQRGCPPGPKTTVREGATTSGNAYPHKAFQAGVSGWAVVDCVVAASGDVTSCALDAESPAGWDFGHTAALLACSFEFTPGSPDFPTGGLFVKTFNFNAPAY